MSEKIVYLSGAMMDCTDEECRDWREQAKQLLNCATRDPVALRDYRGREHEAIAKVVEDDKADIDGCEFVLVNYIKPSVGTSMEVLYAWERGKKVVLVARRDDVVSPWLMYHSQRIFFELREAITYINDS